MSHSDSNPPSPRTQDPHRGYHEDLRSTGSQSPDLMGRPVTSYRSDVPSNTVFDRVRSQVSQRFGVDIDDTITEEVGKVSRHMVPGDAEWKQVTNYFYSKVNARTERERVLCLMKIIKWFILNTTSRRADHSLLVTFPTGVTAAVEDVWRIPSPHSPRSILRHPEAQMIAVLVNTDPRHADEMRAVAQRRHYDTNRMEIAYDFAFADTNPYHKRDDVASIQRSRYLNVNRYRGPANVDDSRVGKEASGGPSGGDAQQSEPFFNNQNRT
uniref:Capsid protein n=1 Tax=Rhizopus microsporus virga-like virus 1 TaxID=3156536 RepID=A0AAT9H890_9VIRU